MNPPENILFLADAMLGRLAKWLRVLGYETLYQRHHSPGSLDHLAGQGRILLTRERKTAARHKDVVLITADRVGDQLKEIRNAVDFAPEPSRYFTICLVCNEKLKAVGPDEPMDLVPEYVFYQNPSTIRKCPACLRFYWPGTHRARMIRTLEAWGFPVPAS
jgi:uncharacterized protein with PIN domain